MRGASRLRRLAALYEAVASLEVQSQMAANRNLGEQGVARFRASCLARAAIRHEFGLNLDDASVAGSDLADGFYEQAVAIEAQRAAEMQEMIEASHRARELIAEYDAREAQQKGTPL